LPRIKRPSVLQRARLCPNLGTQSSFFLSSQLKVVVLDHCFLGSVPLNLHQFKHRKIPSVPSPISVQNLNFLFLRRSSVRKLTVFSINHHCGSSSRTRRAIFLVAIFLVAIQTISRFPSLLVSFSILPHSRRLASQIGARLAILRLALLKKPSSTESSVQRHRLHHSQLTSAHFLSSSPQVYFTGFSARCVSINCPHLTGIFRADSDATCKSFFSRCNTFNSSSSPTPFTPRLQVTPSGPDFLDFSFLILTVNFSFVVRSHFQSFHPTLTVCFLQVLLFSTSPSVS